MDVFVVLYVKIFWYKLENFNFCKFDYLLIESTGISEPLPVATTFDFRDEDGASLSDVAKLDTMVTVVDAANLIKNYSSLIFLKIKEKV